MDPKTATIKEAKQWLRERFTDGASCPCCNQFVKRYKRKLNSSMAHALILIYKYFDNHDMNWLHVPSYLSQISSSATVRGGDWSKLRYWGMIEAESAVRSDGSERVGNYRITNLGKRFVRREVRVLKFVFLYNGDVVAGDGDDTRIYIDEALGEKFNYNELMGKNATQRVERP